MAAGVKHSDATKAAVMASLLAGQSCNQAAQEFKIPVGTIKGWRAESNQVGAKVQPQKKEEIGELLTAYLKTNLETLQAQAEYFRDPDWLAQQSAEGAAILHGVLADKTFRLFEALAASEEGTEGTGSP